MNERETSTSSSGLAPYRRLLVELVAWRQVARLVVTVTTSVIKGT